MLVLVLVLVADVGIQSVLEAHQSLTDGFTCANHGPQYRNGYCAYHGSDRALRRFLMNRSLDIRNNASHLVARALVNLHWHG